MKEGAFAESPSPDAIAHLICEMTISRSDSSVKINYAPSTKMATLAEQRAHAALRNATARLQIFWRPNLKVAIPFVKSEILGLALGSGVSAILLTLIFLHTSFLNEMPYWVRVGAPAGSWLVVMIFFLSHRSKDGKSIEFKIW